MAQVVKELNIKGLNISKFYDLAAERALVDYRSDPAGFGRELKIYLDLRKKTESN